MTDERRRRAERRARGGDAEDKAQLLLQRVRSGEVSGLQLEIAAALGEPAAVKLLDQATPKPVGFGVDDMRLHAALAFVGPWAAIAWATDLLDAVPNRTSYGELDVHSLRRRAVRAGRRLVVEGELPFELTRLLASASSATTDRQQPGSETHAIIDAVAAFAVGLDFFQMPHGGDMNSRARRVATQTASALVSLAAGAWREAVGSTRDDAALKRATEAKESYALAALVLLGTRALGELRDGDGGQEWVWQRDAVAKISREFDRARRVT